MCDEITCSIVIKVMDELKDQDLIEFDSNFIEKLRKNDKATQERCYVLLSPEIYTLLVKICRDRCAANDLLHDTFIKVFDVAESIDNSVNLRAWIKRIAINKALNYLKRNKYLVLRRLVTTYYLSKGVMNQIVHLNRFCRQFLLSKEWLCGCLLLRNTHIKKYLSF